MVYIPRGEEVNMAISWYKAAEDTLWVEDPENLPDECSTRYGRHMMRGCFWMGIEECPTGGVALVAGFEDGRRWYVRCATVGTAKRSLERAIYGEWRTDEHGVSVWWPDFSNDDLLLQRFYKHCAESRK